jgi:1-acyl-sn-glycerol-3-phosphate acyltransferase
MPLADFFDLDASDPAGRDPEFIRTVALPLFDALRTHFRAEIDGVQHVPHDAPFIAIANHNRGPQRR